MATSHMQLYAHHFYPSLIAPVHLIHLCAWCSCWHMTGPESSRRWIVCRATFLKYWITCKHQFKIQINCRVISAYEWFVTSSVLISCGLKLPYGGGKGRKRCLLRFVCKIIPLCFYLMFPLFHTLTLSPPVFVSPLPLSFSPPTQLSLTTF